LIFKNAKLKIIMFYIKTIFRLILYVVITTEFLSYLGINLTLSGILLITFPLFIHAYNTTRKKK